MTSTLYHLRKTRENILNACEELSWDQIIQVPVGFNNNILWNVGHILATQQVLCYSLSYLDTKLPASFVSKYRKGTKAPQEAEESEFNDIKDWLIHTIDWLSNDLNKEIFQ